MERKEQQKRCGPQVFLVPSKNGRPKYPVAPKGSCKPTEQGAKAALAVARQQGNRKVEKKAEALLRRLEGSDRSERR
jgi:hypothetical protein